MTSMKIADNNDVRISRRQWLKRVGAGACWKRKTSFIYSDTITL